MALLVDQGMREGAVGLSSGLEYEVGGYAETGELIELAKVVARYGGVYMSHIRDEADKTLRRAQGSDRDRRRRARRGPDLAHQARHRRRLAQGGRGDRADRGGAAARRRRHRRRVSLQRVAVDDHRAGAEQALRRSAERRAGARRRRRREERADRAPCGASGLRVQDARRDRGRSRSGRRSSSSSRSSRTAAPPSSARRWSTKTSARSTRSRG